MRDLWAHSAVASLASHTPRTVLATKLLSCLIRCAPLDTLHATRLVSTLTLSVPPSSDDLSLLQALMPWSLSADVTAPLVIAYVRCSARVPQLLYSTFWSALRPLLTLVPPAYLTHTQSFDESEAIALVTKLLRIAHVGAVELALELVTRFVRGPAVSQLLASLCAAFASAATSRAEVHTVHLSYSFLTC